MAHSDVYLYGGGGHARVILDILRSQNIKVAAILDDYPPENIREIYGVPIYPAAEELDLIDRSRSRWIVAIGENRIRRQIVNRLIENEFQFAKAIHPSAQIGPGVRISPGTVVMANVVINANATIGYHSIINTGATVDHECTIGDYCHIAPGCSLCGQVRVKDGSFLGVGTTVCPGMEIGEYTTCGAGSVVVKSLPSHVLAYGCPAKIVSSKVIPLPEYEPSIAHALSVATQKLRLA